MRNLIVAITVLIVLLSIPAIGQTPTDDEIIDKINACRGKKLDQGLEELNQASFARDVGWCEELDENPFCAQAYKGVCTGIARTTDDANGDRFCTIDLTDKQCFDRVVLTHGICPENKIPPYDACVAAVQTALDDLESGWEDAGVNNSAKQQQRRKSDQQGATTRTEPRRTQLVEAGR